MSDLPRAGKSSWRYQPVEVREPDGNRVTTLCSVWLGDEDRLTQWAEDPFSAPVGDDANDLAAELVHMVISAYRWKPVPFEALSVGMTFEANFDRVMAEQLAAMLEGVKQ